MVSLDGTASSDDGDYAVNQPGLEPSTRFPLHDCCEFDDADMLRNLIFVPVEGDDDSDNDDDDEEDYDDKNGHNTGDEEDDDDDSVVENASASSSSSDENDSAAAAHAAAIGHSPQPILHGKVLKNGPKATSPESENCEAPSHANGLRDVDDSKNHGEETQTQGTGDKNGGKSNILDDGSGLIVADGSKTNSYSVVDDNNMDVENGETVVANSGSDRQSEKSVQEVGHHQHKHNKVAKKKRYYCPLNLNERDEDEITPIHVAIHCQKLEHVKLLCKAGASLHKKSDGSPPIHVAISMGAIPKHRSFAIDCVRVLYKNDADLTAKDDALHTPLSIACMYNLPEIVNFILSTDAGLSTLNARADRTQGRALHMAAKFDTIMTGANRTVAATTVHARVAHVHHPDGSVVNAMHRIPGFPGKQVDRSSEVAAPKQNPSQKTVTQILVSTPDIEIDAQNSVGQTPLHIACSRGNWNVVRLLLKNGANPSIADRRGFTPGQHAHKRGMPIPNDLLKTLGGPPSSGIIPPPRDLIVDPDNNTILITHELCGLHRTCPPIRRGSNDEPPPENVRRLHVLVDKETGILRTGEFGRCKWENEGRRAALVDVLKCHEYSYVESISQMCSSIPDHPSAVANLDGDTTMSRWSFEAALRAAGSVCEAVDKVVSGDHRNAFCVVRPPGHHAGPRGIVRCENDPDGGSHGFCFLNNVAIGAAYARSMYRNEGIRKIAIVDFDVHHGNGTEEIVRQLVPTVEKSTIRTPFAVGELATQRYRPWLDETDINNVFFASTHGYGPRGLEFANTPSCGWFYPASGKSQISDAINNPSVVESPNFTDFLLSQTWTRMGEDAKGNCCKIINCGLGLPTRDAVPGMQRLEVRDTYRKKNPSTFTRV
mmetsp:Transcript_17698/g.40609  ORF Transcript_17698/g.40609 Transcript_17698/m.40609 type:complete len:883 (-) Transcript_17698:575-3223(-)